MTVRVWQPRVYCHGCYEDRLLVLLLQFAPVSLRQALTASPSFWRGQPDVYAVSLLSCPYFTLHLEDSPAAHRAIYKNSIAARLLLPTRF